MTTHSAPQVSYPVRRSVFLGASLFVVWTAGAGALGYWAYSALLNEWRLVLAGAALAAAGAVSLWGWRASPAGHLAWDGLSWRWQSAAYSTGESVLQLAVALDLQRVLWLRLDNSDGASLWLLAEKSALPHRWMDLRRAVVSSSGRAAGPLASPL